LSWGLLSVLQSLPFGLAVGIGRRSYYAGTALLAVALAAVCGLALAVLQVIERPAAAGG
jgi:branched-subunit amino acid ABC-type transport system permease component